MNMVMVLVPPKKKPPTPIAVALGLKLKTVRQRTGKTQKEVGDALGIDHKTVSAYENGRAVLGADDFGDWARALGISIAELSTGLGLCLPAETGNFRQDLSVLFGPDDSEAVEELIRDMAGFPESDRRQLIETLRDQVTGRHTRRQRNES